MSGSVLVPLNSANALPRYNRAGVGEIYVGFHDKAWNVRFGEHADLNRMSGFGEEANPFSFDEMLGHVRTARDLGISVYVCFNAAAYDGDQIAYIACEYLPALAEAGARGVIVSGQALVPSIVDIGLQPVISTVAGVFNARIVDYYRRLGATRVILPRDLSIDEIGSIVEAVPDVEYEVFLMRNGCMFSDSHCLGRHCAGEPSLCTALRTGKQSLHLVDDDRQCPSSHVRDDSPRDFLERAWRNEELLNRYYHRRTCGLCALWRFEQMGIAAYKVVGRGDDLDDLCADAGLVVRNVKLARTCSTEVEYVKRMERPREPETLCGYRGLSCYYPDALYWNQWGR